MCVCVLVWLPAPEDLMATAHRCSPIVALCRLPYCGSVWGRGLLVCFLLLSRHQSAFGGFMIKCSVPSFTFFSEKMFFQII